MKHVFIKVFGILSAVIAFISASCSVSAPQQHNRAAEIIIKTCSTCHSVDKVCNALGSKDRNAWTRTIYGMKQAGARVDEGDIPMLAEYLAGLEPGSKPVCK